MKQKLLSLMIFALMVISIVICAHAANTTGPVAMINDTSYSSLQAAIDHYTDGCIRLIAPEPNAVIVNKNICLDLNGNSVTGQLTVKDGYTLYGMDCQTDEYAVTDISYGKLTNAICEGTGVITGVTTDLVVSEDSYLKVTENSVISFHRVNLQIHTMTLRADTVGAYYKSYFAGDALVAKNVKAFGVALSVVEEPNANNMGDTNKYSTFDGKDFKAGMNDSDITSTLLYDIMKPSNAKLINKSNALKAIYGRAYILTNDGEYLFGQTVCRTLTAQTQGVDAKWNTLSNDQKESVLNMYAQYQSVMKDWNISNIENAYCAVTTPQFAKKTCSLTAGNTVSPGEQIRYDILIQNKPDATQTFTVTDTVPANTTYVSGAEAVSSNKLIWTVTLAPGESTTLSYTVKVKEDISLCEGGIVKGTPATVSNTQLPCHDIYIERTLNKLDTDYVVTGIKALSDSSYSGLDLAQRIYTLAFTVSNAIADHVTDTALDEIAAGNSENTVLLDMVAPTLFGGKTMPETIDGIKGASAGSVTREDLVIGDLLLADDKVYIYSSDGLYDLAQGAVKADTASILTSLTDADKYAVLRSSIGMTNVTRSAAETDVLSDYQKVLKATAKAYLLRGEKLQYADTRFTSGGSSYGSEYRWLVKENTPEDCNDDSWGYTNCAAFTYEVYYQALGYPLPDNMFTTARLMSNAEKNNMLAYLYTREGDSVQTDAEKQTVHDEFTAALQPGDILVIRRSNGSGHAMLYVGDGKIIHSGGNVYKYTASVGTEVFEASIRCMNAEDYFFNSASETGYVFNLVTSLAIVRPLNVFNGEIPQSTINRMENMQGIVAQKLSSHVKANTVNPGEEMTFTYKLYNTNDVDVTLDIAETLPENTTYISGAQQVDGNKLSWAVTVPAGARVSVSYTLKVNADTPYGTKIQSTDSTVGGVTVKCDAVQVRRSLTAAEQAAVVEAVQQLRSEGNSLTGLALANEIYKRALGVENIFASTDFATVTRGTTGCFQNYITYSNKQIYQCNPDSIYYDMIAPTLYGGYRLYTPTYAYDRTRLPKEQDLQAGDVLFGKTSSTENLWIYLGEELGFVKLDASLSADTVAVALRLERLLGFGNYFVVMRPSMSLESAQ